MAITNVHVQGGAKIQVNTGSGYTDLGYSEDGVTMNFLLKQKDIFTDQFGEGVPIDVLFLGYEATIEMELISWDTTVLNTVINWSRGETIGSLAHCDYGSPYIGDTRYLGLQINGCTVGQYIWTFGIAWVVDTASLTIGTRESRWSLTWRAIPTVGASTRVLFTRTAIS